jgi:hypothetical protein
MPDADKYRILDPYAGHGAEITERDRRQAEYIAAAEGWFNIPPDDDKVAYWRNRYFAARDALLKHMEEHP